MLIILVRLEVFKFMVKIKTFKNYKLCRKFITDLTMRFKRRFKHLALYFVINTKGNKIKYYQIKDNSNYTISSCKSL